MHGLATNISLHRVNTPEIVFAYFPCCSGHMGSCANHALVLLPGVGVCAAVSSARSRALPRGEASEMQQNTKFLDTPCNGVQPAVCRLLWQEMEKYDSHLVHAIAETFCLQVEGR